MKLPFLVGLSLCCALLVPDVPAQTQLAKITLLDAAAGDRFGQGVAASGTRLLVGAPNDDDQGSMSGAAYVFELVGSGWVQQAKLLASDGAANRFFGNAVALRGGVALVGAPMGASTGSGSGTGAAYVFEEIAGTWVQTAKLTCSGTVSGHVFGWSVALDETGTRAAVGAPGTAGARTCVFEKTGSTWAQVASLTVPGGFTNSSFGLSVGLSGDRLVSGAPNSNAFGFEHGAAYVYLRGAGGGWSLEATLEGSDSVAGDQFAYAVAIDGDRILAGQRRDDTGASVDHGSAYVFERSGAAWTQTAKLLGADTSAGDELGSLGVALCGDLALVGAWRQDPGGVADAGAAYVFGLSGASWTQVGKLVAGDAAFNDRLGYSVAMGLCGVHAIAGTPIDDGTAGADQGAVYVYALPGSEPVADAGADQSVPEGAFTVLDGSASTGPAPLGYAWTQIAGTPVLLDDPSSGSPGFHAPFVGVGGETLSFQLVVQGGAMTSEPDVVNVTVTNVNNAPFADAGLDAALSEGSVGQLDGTGSFDVDGDPFSFAWSQIGGPVVMLLGADGPQPTFVAPLVGPSGTVLTFLLVVDDGLALSADEVHVTVVNVNVPPTADAGLDQTVDSGTPVALDGSASSDPDGDALTHAWTQLAGPAVALDLADPAHPTFTAPLVAPGGEDLLFALVVDDGVDASEPDHVVVHVLSANDPPLCSAAQGGSLWPPNHALVPVTITGIVDPDGEGAPTITITAVRQDEPVNGLGDGDTSPDAVVQDGVLYLRAERAGAGNGRVYHVSFVADDGAGGTCTGTVTFTVPHSKKKPAIDGGPLHDSFGG